MSGHRVNFGPKLDRDYPTQKPATENFVQVLSLKWMVVFNSLSFLSN
jgi:hypothetical protein